MLDANNTTGHTNTIYNSNTINTVTNIVKQRKITMELYSYTDSNSKKALCCLSLDLMVNQLFAVLGDGDATECYFTPNSLQVHFSLN
jgi:hypothetical protein